MKPKRKVLTVNGEFARIGGVEWLPGQEMRQR